MPEAPDRTRGHRLFSVVIEALGSAHTRVWAGAFVLLLAGCGQEPPLFGLHALPLDAFCAADVVGVGSVDVETEYLPRVVACENGEAPPEALRAQAVAARSYLYYTLLRDGVIRDGPDAQVYTCAKTPDERHLDAVRTTAGEVLAYQGVQVAAFYVAGAIPSTESCRPEIDDADPFDTENFVTYNAGQTGTDVVQTTLGSVDPENLANRGCMSQNGAACLAAVGKDYKEILSFFYGRDIDLVTSFGPCIEVYVSPCTISALEPTLVDDSDGCFLHDCDGLPEWTEVATGIGAQHRRLAAGAGAGAGASCEGRWRFNFAAEGEYLVEVHIPEGAPGASAASYEVHHQEDVTVLSIAQTAVDTWLTLGTFRFDVGDEQWVQLHRDEGTASTGDLIFDAVRLTPTAVRELTDEPGGSLGIGGGCSSGGRPHAPWAIAALIIGVYFGVGRRWRYPQPRRPQRMRSRARMR
ncbi:MAG: hypothetical protein IPK13_20375 [Deltaproteobacteria bacterium]|nr:hypothetical protein [Deltaproteobacteria bacterium]